MGYFEDLLNDWGLGFLLGKFKLHEAASQSRQKSQACCWTGIKCLSMSHSLRYDPPTGDVSFSAQYRVYTSLASANTDHRGVVWVLEGGVRTPVEWVAVSVPKLALALVFCEAESVAVGRCLELKELIW